MQKSDKGTRILVVEDRHNMMRTLISMLNQLGLYHTFKAYDGVEAWSLLNDGEVIDLVISDWNMPLMTGIELVRKIRDDDRFRDLPFLMITGEVDRSTVAEAAEEEVDSYLIKPFSMKDLREKIVELLTRKHRPGPLDILLKSARDNLRTGRYFEAEDDLNKALEINHQSPRVAYYFGMLHERRDDLDQARQAFELAVAVSPHFIKAREALSRVLRAMGDLKGATTHLRVAVDLSPNNIERQLTFSQCLGKTGQRSELKKVLKNIMKLAGKQHADIARQVGETYLEAGLADEARKAFVKALAEDPNDVYTYNRLGIALRRQKKFSEAIRYYQKALKIDPENDNLYYNIARAYHESGDKKKSLEALEKALEINPDFWEAKALLAKVSDS